MSGNQVSPGLLLRNILPLDFCPHCGTARPFIGMPNQANWVPFAGHDGKRRLWGVYGCSSCGKLIVAVGDDDKPETPVKEIYPVPKSPPEEVPQKPKEFLRQAYLSLSAPAGAVMLCASAVDAMLKAHGYDQDSLYDRIEKAVSNHLLTKEMGEWAHHVRLEANDQRHADKNAGFPTQEQAEQSIEFTEALAEILFVLPDRARRGIIRAKAVGTSTTFGSLTVTTSPAADKADTSV